MRDKRRLLFHRILQALIVLSAMGVLYSAFLLISVRREYAEGDNAYRQLRMMGGAADITQPQGTGQESAGTEKAPPRKKPDFAELEKINPDVAAWLSEDGTGIDYPVVRGEDNAYYLTHLFTGKKNKLGTIFMDYRNSRDFSDPNTVLYGHNMKDGSMFYSLTKYKKQSYYNRFPTMRLDTPDGSIQIALFAGVVVDGNYDSVRLKFSDNRDFESYVASLKGKSTFSSDVSAVPGDRIVTLCTCSYEFDNARYALFGKLLPDE